MHKLKKALLPVIMVIAMLVMSVSASAASSPTAKKLGKVTVSPASYTYNAYDRTPKVTVKDADGKSVAGKYYTVFWKNNEEAGTATVTVKGKAPYTGSAKTTFKIKRAGAYAFVNKPAKTTVTVKAKDVKKKAKKVGRIDEYLKRSSKKYTKSVGVKATYKTNSKYVKVSKKGYITVKKGAKKGTYKITVKLKATKRNYKAATRTITVKVK